MNKYRVEIILEQHWELYVEANTSDEARETATAMMSEANKSKSDMIANTELIGAVRG